MRECIFLDRDGVIINNKDDYIRSLEDVAFLPGVLPALARIATSHYALIILTNQSVIGKGFIGIQEHEIIHEELLSVIKRNGGRIDAIYTCPHRTEDNCDCRKPKPGLFLRAAQEYDIDLKNSFMIGDALSDIEASIAAGCRPVFVLSGRGRDQLPLFPPHIRNTLVVFDGLPNVIDWLLSGRHFPDQIKNAR